MERTKRIELSAWMSGLAGIAAMAMVIIAFPDIAWMLVFIAEAILGVAVCGHYCKMHDLEREKGAEAPE